MSKRIPPLPGHPYLANLLVTSLCAVLLLASPAFTDSVACAAIPKLSSLLPLDSQKSDAAPTALTPAQQRENIKQALATAESQRNVAQAALAGLYRQDAKEKFRLLDGRVARLNTQLNLLDEREDVRRTRARTGQKTKAWVGFATPPPYSILMVDEITSSVLTARGTSRGLALNQELLQRQVTHYQEAAAQARELERQTTDELEQAQTADKQATAARQKELAGIRAANADTMSEVLTLRYEVLGERIAVAGIELELLERQRAEAARQTVFSRKDLDKALTGLASSRANLEQELEAALTRDARSRSELARLRQQQDAFTLRHGAADTSAAAVTRRIELEAQRAALAWVDASRFETETLSALITITKSSSSLWEQRYAAVNGNDTEKRRTILADFNASREHLKPWLEFTKQQLEIYQAAEHQQELRMVKIDQPGALRAAEVSLMAARQLQRELAERQKIAVEQADRERQAWQEDIERRQHSRSIADRSKAWLKAVPNILRSIWRFELFAIEDSVEVAGQKVVTSRGVTVGKSAGALFLFLIGYSIAAFLGQRTQRVMISRFRISAHQANVIRRWLMALAVFILLIITLNLARIPLTVFAFLGGALAIGVGFGTQTLIKNFISGILILLERNVKVGDTIDVDGVVGRIITVDIRASTILGFDGVETVIPNSTFLENKVTNWTHSNAKLRRVVRVGVAYGSPLPLVHDLLTECATAHKLILKDPPPEALFEDFGESALVFALYFWVEHGPETNPLHVASDLRFMINQRFAEQKVVLAFPQRDVHLDCPQPLHIKLESTCQDDQHQ